MKRQWHQIYTVNDFTKNDNDAGKNSKDDKQEKRLLALLDDNWSGPGVDENSMIKYSMKYQLISNLSLQSI